MMKIIKNIIFIVILKMAYQWTTGEYEIGNGKGINYSRFRSLNNPREGNRPMHK